MNTQSKALRLADQLGARYSGFPTCDEAAGELRRLSAIEDEWARLSQDEGKPEREIERLRMMNKVLLETLKAAYNHAANHDESLPFDWALHCEMLHTGEMLHTAITKAEEQS
jgi:hypothetical protein